LYEISICHHWFRPTGLGAAYRLKELGIKDFIVLEKENYIGGLPPVS
jgi:cation diffusion facilitator CzcD-associated flavoprotein CzcO